MPEKDDPYAAVFLDRTRSERTGFSESILCEGKNLDQIAAIIEKMRGAGQNIFGTRLAPEAGEQLTKQFQGLQFHPLSRTFQWVVQPPPPLRGQLGILAAGTSDLTVAEEAFQTAQFYGLEATRFYDVGVAGLHRLLSQLEAVQACDVLIVVAGMDGALPSVVAGLVKAPVIACPTRVGYGVHREGWTTLCAMLNACSEGITVVNIDNGFGAACAALRILRKIF